MGLRFSAEKILGWRSQHNAMLRWYERCEARHHPDNSYNTEFFDALDHISAFFVFSFHLYDYVAETGRIGRSTLTTLVQADASMRKCRDIAIRIKHHTMSSNPLVDANWSVAREYIPFGETGAKLIFILGNESIDAMDLVRACVRFWEEIIRSGVLSEPENPFADNNTPTDRSQD